MKNNGADQYAHFKATSKQIKILITALLWYLDIIMCEQQLTVKRRVHDVDQGWAIVECLLQAKQRLTGNASLPCEARPMSNNTHCGT